MRRRDRARQRIVQKARSQRLSRFAVVYEFLAECLAQSLHRPAFELSLDDPRVYNGSHVIDRAIRYGLDRAGGRVDLDFADVSAVGPGRVRHGACRIDGELRLWLDLRQLEEPDPAIGADHRADAVGVFHVADRNLQLPGRELARLRHGALRGDVHRGATDEERARSGTARPGGIRGRRG